MRAGAYQQLPALDPGPVRWTNSPEQQRVGLASPEVKRRSLLRQSRPLPRALAEQTPQFQVPMPRPFGDGIVPLFWPESKVLRAYAQEGYSLVAFEASH